MYEAECEFTCTFDRLYDYIDKLKSYETQTRAEIECHKNSNHGWKYEKSLNKPLYNLVKQKPIFEENRISQLELSKTCRAFGFYKKNIFHFVFLDKDHEGYAVHKK